MLFLADVAVWFIDGVGLDDLRFSSAGVVSEISEATSAFLSRHATLSAGIELIRGRTTYSYVLHNSEW